MLLREQKPKSAPTREALKREAYYDPNDYYLLVVPAMEDADRLGFMPRTRSFGFLNAARLTTPAAFIHTAAHELGHGAFHLQHIFDRFPDLRPGVTNNLMDYGDSTTLYKYQWDNIHDPESNFSLFDEEGEGALEGGEGQPYIVMAISYITGENFEKRDIYICGKYQNADVSENERDAIEEKILIYLKGGVEDGNYKVAWTCEAPLTGEIPFKRIDENMRSSNQQRLKIFGFALSKSTDGLTLNYFLKDNSWMPFSFALSDGSNTYSGTEGDNRFSIADEAFSSFTPTTNFILETSSSQNQGNNKIVYGSVEMIVNFEDTTLPDRNYALFFNDALVNSSTTIELQSPYRCSFTAKELIGEDYTSLTSQNNSFYWKVNGGLIPNQEDATFEYTFNPNSGQTQAVSLLVNGISLVANLSLLAPEAIPDGYIIPDDPDDFVKIALERIEAENPGLHGALRTGRNTNINLAPTIQLEAGLTGTTMGTAEAQIIDASRRLFIDPETVIRATTGPNRYLGCPIGAVLYMRISGDELSTLYRAFIDGSTDVPLVVDRIADVYPEEANQLRGWIINDVEPGDQLTELLEDRKISFKPSEEEVVSVLTVGAGTIALNVAGLADLSLYAERPFEVGAINYGSYDWGEYERTNISGARELRQRQYTRVLAHEMQHIHHKLTNIQTAYIWQIMDDVVPYVSYCYPARSGSVSGYCSQAGGHEYQNPDGQSACSEEDKYPRPRVNN